MNLYQLFLPCPAGVEPYLATEVARILGEVPEAVGTVRGGVRVEASWREMMLLNLHVRLAQRVLVQLADVPYKTEDDVYAAANEVVWESWFTPKQRFRVDITAQHCPLQSLNFAALRVKDGLVDRLRQHFGTRPDVDTHQPHVRVHAHLDASHITLYMDTSGEPLFKRGWREDKGDAPLKETLAAAMIAATEWDAAETPLYDPCCGSGTIAIEAAQIACGIPAGLLRRFAFVNLLPHEAPAWQSVLGEAQASVAEQALTRQRSGFMAAMCPFVWSTLPRAMPSGRGSAMRWSCAVATPYSVAPQPIGRAFCCSTRRMASASPPPALPVTEHKTVQRIAVCAIASATVTVCGAKPPMSTAKPIVVRATPSLTAWERIGSTTLQGGAHGY